MVSKITIFEPHFDGAQFGPTTMPGGEDAEPTEETGSEVPVTEAEETGGSRGGLLLAAAAVVLAVGLGIAVSRRLGAESEEVEASDSAGKISIE